MTYWTIQTKSVIARFEKDGCYYPDFSLSPQTHIETYRRLLDTYNESNSTTYKGLLFCMTKDDARTFQDGEDFGAYFASRPSVVHALNNGDFSLFDNTHSLLCIRTDKFDSFNPCLVDFWNFIMMTSDTDGINADSYYMQRELHPSLNEISYEEFVSMSWGLMKQGKMIKPLMQKTMLQANIPYIDNSMEIEVLDLPGGY